MDQIYILELLSKQYTRLCKPLFLPCTPDLTWDNQPRQPLLYLLGQRKISYNDRRIIHAPDELLSRPHRAIQTDESAR